MATDVDCENGGSDGAIVSDIFEWGIETDRVVETGSGLYRVVETNFLGDKDEIRGYLKGMKHARSTDKDTAPYKDDEPNVSDTPAEWLDDGNADMLERLKGNTSGDDGHTLSVIGRGKVDVSYELSRNGSFSVTVNDIVRTPMGRCRSVECSCGETFEYVENAKQHLHTVQYEAAELDSPYDPFSVGDTIIGSGDNGSVSLEVLEVNGDEIQVDHSNIDAPVWHDRQVFHSMLENTPDVEIDRNR